MQTRSCIFSRQSIIAAVAILTLGVIPYGRNMTPFTIDGGILFFFAVGSTTELAVFMAGWASNNKFSMLGAMRAIAQMFSYELPLIITVLPVVMVVGSLMPDRIVAAQGGYTFGIVPRWFVFTPWGAAAFILFFVSGLVESNRTPFDVPEGESEIVAGHMTEYSGFKYATFFMAEYLGMFAVSGLAVTLFLGGWHAPRGVLEIVPSYVWFFVKLSALLFVYIWLRGDAPAHARRSNDECRLEIHVADGVHLHHRRGCLALCRARLTRLAVVAVRDRGCLQLRCRSCWTREGNSRRAFIVSPNEQHRVHCHFGFHARRGARGGDVAESDACRALFRHWPCLGSRPFSFCSARSSSAWCMVFIYVGAVAVLIVFTILLTRRDSRERSWFQLERCAHRPRRVWRFDAGRFSKRSRLRSSRRTFARSRSNESAKR